MKDPQFREIEQSISLHGLGFVQVRLQAKQRLHVWHPDLPRRTCFKHSSIHDHRFAFVSKVLVGVQRNVRYEETEVPVGHGTHVAYRHDGMRYAQGGRPWDACACVTVRQAFVQDVYAGEVYTMPAYMFHETRPLGDGRVATLMTKTFEGTEGARSLCAIGVTPDTDFDRHQLSATALWDVVADVLGGRAVDAAQEAVA
ncbi:MAG: hypothetical protein E2576_11120 [Alcaligenaceae bacterium]|nr:hypothetical protein [Alcaligenaceae bacterium SAGV5]MPS51241.1 hypothetical protein [Alcaligenaceae bacterium SAGV3]MPT57262.1 hypothetical protein [Alcaligenaceae bacterium]